MAKKRSKAEGAEGGEELIAGVPLRRVQGDEADEE